jgi:hypothetical protein
MGAVRFNGGGDDSWAAYRRYCGLPVIGSGFPGCMTFVVASARERSMSEFDQSILSENGYTHPVASTTYR